MKKVFLFVALIGAANFLSAQFDLKGMLQRQKENIYKKVENLSPLQTELINGIFDEYGETLTETFQEARRTRNYSGIREKMEALGEERNLLIKDVLNDEQYTVYLKIVEDGRPKRESSND